jgi:hypothetical protein
MSRAICESMGPACRMAQGWDSYPPPPDAAAIKGSRCVRLTLCWMQRLNRTDAHVKMESGKFSVPSDKYLLGLLALCKKEVGAGFGSIRHCKRGGIPSQTHGEDRKSPSHGTRMKFNGFRENGSAAASAAFCFSPGSFCAQEAWLRYSACFLAINFSKESGSPGTFAGGS